MPVKTQSEIAFAADTAQTSGANVITYWLVANYFGNVGSIGTLEYSLDLGTTWNTCTLAATQTEADLDNIPLNSRKRKIPIIWAAGTDINILETFTNVQVRATFYDRSTQTGTQSETQTLTIDALDMRPQSAIIPIRPYPGEPDLNFKFKTLIAVQNVKLHFRIDVAAEADTGFATPVFTAMSETDQTNWQYDGGAFPAAGVDAALSRSEMKEVTYSDPALAALSDGNYNIRIMRSLHDPAGILPPTYPW